VASRCGSGLDLAPPTPTYYIFSHMKQHHQIFTTELSKVTKHWFFWFRVGVLFFLAISHIPQFGYHFLFDVVMLAGIGYTLGYEARDRK
jgi:hypothetical protein